MVIIRAGRAHTDEIGCAREAHRHLARYACEVSRDRRYVCSGCGKPVKDLDAVRKRLDAKKDFITCHECDEKVPLMDFIEQRLKSDPVARKIAAFCSTRKVSGLLRFWRWTRRAAGRRSDWQLPAAATCHAGLPGKGNIAGL